MNTSRYIRPLVALPIAAVALACSADEDPLPEESEALAPRFGEAEYRSAGCDNPRIPPHRFENHTLDVDAGPSPRNYRVGVPPGYDPHEPHALFFFMHACGASHLSVHGTLARVIGEMSGIPTITVGPDSLVGDWSGDRDALGTDGRKCWNLNGEEYYDIAFIDALVDQLLQDYCIDTRNVFFSGSSSGAFGGQGLGCHVQATAIVADRGGISHPEGTSRFFPVTPPPFGACEPIPVLLGLARGDTAVPYDPYGAEAVDFWQTTNECRASAARDTTAESFVCQDGITGCECLRYDGCVEPFVLCQWDGDHSSMAISSEAQAWWFTEALDGGPGIGEPPPVDPDPGACRPSSEDFVATFQLDSSLFPWVPYCDACLRFGVADGAGTRADLEMRWSSGLDPRVDGDSAIQWFEQRPDHNPTPFVRIIGNQEDLIFSTSVDGVEYRERFSVSNPLQGPVELVDVEGRAFLQSATLDARECSPGPVACNALDGSAFDVEFSVDSSRFPISPFCDGCRSFGVTSGAEEAAFTVRWSNGLDAVSPGDANIQWIEQRSSTGNAFPFVRIVGEGPELAFYASTDGVAWELRLSADNPFEGGAVSTFGEDEALLLETVCR